MNRFKSILWHRFISRLPEFEVTANTLHGKMTFSNKDQVIGRMLFVQRDFDYDKCQKTLALLKENGLLQKDKPILLDIGANIGTVCIPLVRDRLFDQAIAFEPEPKNFRFLKKNILLNHLEAKIHPINRGLSAKNGTMELLLSPDNFGNHQIVAARPSPSAIASGSGKPPLNVNIVQVQVQRLDEALAENKIPFEKVGLLWMDVQGHEKFVLDGATELLKHKPPVVAEFWPYGLKAAGVLPDNYCEFAARYFSGFYDLSDASPKRKDISEIFSLYEKYKGEDFTDLLLL